MEDICAKHNLKFQFGCFKCKSSFWFKCIWENNSCYINHPTEIINYEGYKIALQSQQQNYSDMKVIEDKLAISKIEATKGFAMLKQRQNKIDIEENQLMHTIRSQINSMHMIIKEKILIIKQQILCKVKLSKQIFNKSTIFAKQINKSYRIKSELQDPMMQKLSRFPKEIDELFSQILDIKFQMRNSSQLISMFKKVQKSKSELSNEQWNNGLNNQYIKNLNSYMFDHIADRISKIKDINELCFKFNISSNNHLKLFNNAMLNIKLLKTTREIECKHQNSSEFLLKSYFFEGKKSLHLLFLFGILDFGKRKLSKDLRNIINTRKKQRYVSVISRIFINLFKKMKQRKKKDLKNHINYLRKQRKIQQSLLTFWQLELHFHSRSARYESYRKIKDKRHVKKYYQTFVNNFRQVSNSVFQKNRKTLSNLVIFNSIYRKAGKELSFERKRVHSPFLFKFYSYSLHILNIITNEKFGLSVPNSSYELDKIKEYDCEQHESCLFICRGTKLDLSVKYNYTYKSQYGFKCIFI